MHFCECEMYLLNSSKALPDLFISQLKAEIVQYQISANTLVLLEEWNC